MLFQWSSRQAVSHSVCFHETWDSSNNFGLRSTFVVSKPLRAATKHYVAFHLQELHYISWKGLICMQVSFITAFTHYPKDSQLSSLFCSKAHLFTHHCSIIYSLTMKTHSLNSSKAERHWDFSLLYITNPDPNIHAPSWTCSQLSSLNSSTPLPTKHLMVPQLCKCTITCPATKAGNMKTPPHLVLVFM